MIPSQTLEEMRDELTDEMRVCILKAIDAPTITKARCKMLYTLAEDEIDKINGQITELEDAYNRPPYDKPATDIGEIDNG